MSKKQKTLLRQAKELVAEVKRTHVYSMSKIYGIYNQITGKNDVPQSCSSCLIRKINFIENWIATEEKTEEKPPVSEIPSSEKETQEEHEN